MKRTLPLVAVLIACGLGLGYGTTAASGPAPVAPHVELDTAERTAEPTARTYLAAPPTIPAAPVTPMIETAPVHGSPLSIPSSPAPVEAAAPADATPQPVPIAAPVGSADDPHPMPEIVEPVGTARPADDVCGFTADELVDHGYTADEAARTILEECGR